MGFVAPLFDVHREWYKVLASFASVDLWSSMLDVPGAHTAGK